MNDGEAVEANAQSLGVVQPGDGTFDDPASFAKAAAMWFAAASNLGADAVGMQRLAILVVVVSTITVDDAWLGQWSTGLATDRRNRFDQRYQLGYVIAIGTGQY